VERRFRDLNFEKKNPLLETGADFFYSNRFRSTGMRERGQKKLTCLTVPIPPDKKADPSSGGRGVANVP
jgi:hypothetical protein